MMSVAIALRMAQDEGSDLVEIAPTARPPVCHIMDYGKFRFDQSIKERESETSEDDPGKGNPTKSCG